MGGGGGLGRREGGTGEGRVKRQGGGGGGGGGGGCVKCSWGSPLKAVQTPGLRFPLRTDSLSGS